MPTDASTPYDIILRHLPGYFPLFLVGLSIVVTALLQLLSGWLRLSARFPDQVEEPLLQLHGQSGTMGLGVGMNGILTLSVCLSGLRIGVPRIFGLFRRACFVPWREIAVTRRTRFLRDVAELRFGDPAVGKLRIAAHVADRLANAAQGRWPEAGPFPAPIPGRLARHFVLRWIALSGVAALFLSALPRLLQPNLAPPLALTILFPAVVIGIGLFLQFRRER